jgi:hypothetical protein
MINQIIRMIILEFLVKLKEKMFIKLLKTITIIFLSIKTKMSTNNNTNPNLNNNKNNLPLSLTIKSHFMILNQLIKYKKKSNKKMKYKNK